MIKSNLLCRSFFVLIAMAVSLATTVQAENASASNDSRPNVLRIYLEDVSGWFSCYGDSIIETPNIDDLAKSGIRFDRFYTPAGVCSATRSAIVTGMMQTSIGAHNHRSCRPVFRGKPMGEFDENILPDSVVPLPIRLKQAGYWTFNEGGKDDYNFTFDEKEFYDFVRGKGGWAPRSFLAGDCLEGIKEGQPFFGQLQLGGGKLGKKTPKVIDRETVPVPPYYPDIPEVREEIAHHYDCLIKTDDQVGQVLAKLREIGELDNTLIFMFSDHGYKLHRHKQFLYEGGIQMPLVVAGPGIPAGEVRDDLISGIDITAASLAATGSDVPENMEGRDFLAEGYEPRDYLVAARDRCDYTIEKIRAVVTPRYKYLKNYLPERPFMQASYKDSWEVSKRFRELMAAGTLDAVQLQFFGDTKSPEELYDLEKDPHEIHNLAEDPQFADVLAQHRGYLAEWVSESGDQGQAPESDIGLLCTLKRWGDKCVAPDYDRVRPLLSSDKRTSDDRLVTRDPNKSLQTKGPGTHAKRGSVRNSRSNPLPGASAASRHPAHGSPRHQPSNQETQLVSVESKRPNVLFIFADDQCYDTIAHLGNEEVETPNLDRLAKSGLTFTHAFNMGSWSGAVCIASRTMLNSGRMLWNAKDIHAQSEAEREAGRWWGPLMKSGGYRTYMTGKWHCRAKAEKSFDVAKNVRPGMPKAFPEGYN
ncbi:MAG: sulfatase-like hydrolase/transferase, partial [Planctomycetota bacterium]